MWNQETQPLVDGLKTRKRQKRWVWVDSLFVKTRVDEALPEPSFCAPATLPCSKAYHTWSGRPRPGLSRGVSYLSTGRICLVRTIQIKHNIIFKSSLATWGRSNKIYSTIVSTLIRKNKNITSRLGTWKVRGRLWAMYCRDWSIIIDVAYKRSMSRF